MNAADALTAMRRDGLYVRDQYSDVHHWDANEARVVTNAPGGVSQVRVTAESWLSLNRYSTFEEVRHGEE